MLVYIVHVVTVAAIAEWWVEADGEQGDNTCNALRRALCTSLGSIALGSLILAVIKATRDALKSAEQEMAKQGDGQALCVIRCLLGVIERLLEIFNRYAFCYVAIYGTSMYTSGKNTLALFKELGWVREDLQGHQPVHYHHHRHLHLHLHLQTAVINDDLVEIALTFSALLGAFLCGLLSYLLSFVMLGDGWGIAAFVLGLLIGYFAMALALQVVNSGVAGIFVLWCVVC